MAWRSIVVFGNTGKLDSSAMVVISSKYMCLSAFIFTPDELIPVK